MSDTSMPVAGPNEGRAARDLDAVRAYLDATMQPDPERARRYVAEGFVARFTGGRIFDDPSGPTTFNMQRYRSIAKRMERFDVASDGERTIVYSLGTLYGEWSDGTPFEGNRYVDRFVVRDGLIEETDVWNDSGEWLLDPSLAR